MIPGAIELAFERLIVAVVRVLPAIAIALIVLGVFWGLAYLARRAAKVLSTYIRSATVRMLVPNAEVFTSRIVTTPSQIQEDP